MVKDFTKFGQVTLRRYGFVYYKTFKMASGHRKLWFSGHTGLSQDGSLQRITKNVERDAKAFFGKDLLRVYFKDIDYPLYSSINVMLR